VVDTTEEEATLGLERWFTAHELLSEKMDNDEYDEYALLHPFLGHEPEADEHGLRPPRRAVPRDGLVARELPFVLTLPVTATAAVLTGLTVANALWPL
jgi:hypothetical protein